MNASRESGYLAALIILYSALPAVPVLGDPITISEIKSHVI